MPTASQVESIRDYLKSFDLSGLFIEELGWDHPPRSTVIVRLEIDYVLTPVAQKRGMVVYVCDADVIPTHPCRQKVEREATKAAHEHIIVFVDRAKTTQVWQWVRREPGRPAATRQHTFYAAQPGDSLIQKLVSLAFSLDEEEGLTVTAVAGRARQAFDVDRVTKRFFDRFKAEHAAFLQFVAGIQSQGDREWYASLMLNRLMFVYFIQRKGFLDGDTDYLRNRLGTMRASRGHGSFFSFYRHFLLRLFHEGLGGHDRSSELDQLLGSVPYLNGGLFDVHTLEHQYSDIQIDDDAFEKIFDFFDAYSWHLDERPLRADNEINPDVLGYIFEKYINQKEMGAYYTKEDITGYIGSNCIIPNLIDTVDICQEALKPQGTAWQRIQDDPDRYIYPEVLRGVDSLLPEFIAEGIGDPAMRSQWNTPASTDVGLPSETWREYVSRRDRCSAIRNRLGAGDIASVDDFVVLNLNIGQLAHDIIADSDDPYLVHAFYEAIRNVKILDPTCGSGAFLFAAVTILEPLYDACLERMQAYVEDGLRDGEAAGSEDLEDFVKILDHVATHANRRYFILKSIVLNNLFGVDMMEEAVEICKLRLFLKLAAQLESIDDIEPLPDIDFNIRPGNTLVGFASFDEIKSVVNTRLEFDDTTDQIDSRAAACAASFSEFRRIQTETNGSGMAVAKADLTRSLGLLEDELDNFLAAEFNADDIESWRSSHQPFHWLVDFYAVLASGGFDVIVGNPPYVEYRTIDTYEVRGCETLACGDLYAFVMERALALLKRGGRLGMITPVSILGTDGFAPLRKLLLKDSTYTYVQGFADRPSKLFTGVEKRLAIWMMKRGTGPGRMYASKYRRWLSEERSHLFATTALTDITGISPLVGSSLPKIETPVEAAVLNKLAKRGKPLSVFYARRSAHIVYYTRKVRYFVQFFLSIPKKLDANGHPVPPSELKMLNFGDPAERDAAVVALNSSLWFWFFSVYSDVRNVNSREIDFFPIDLTKAAQEYGSELSPIARDLMADFEENSTLNRINYKKYGMLTIQTFRPRLSKPIIDRADHVLAKLYELNDEEIDFIINSDIKYRLGQEEAAEDDSIG